MHYTVYKVTNKINGKVYIGTHKTRNLDDGYMGSGKYLKRAIEKHGIDNFTKEILFIYDAPEPMFAKEAELVNEDFISEENTYNIKVGGFGGFDYINSNPEKCSPEKRFAPLLQYRHLGPKKYKEKYLVNEEFKRVINERLAKMREKCAEKYEYGPFKGRSHNATTKSIMSEKAKERMAVNNPHKGTIWITDGAVNKKIDKAMAIPIGWHRGRK